MAFRIHDSVVRGEIDNRVKGIVYGKILLEGLQQPLILELTGNAHPDLAGCKLTFVNPRPRMVDPSAESLSALQRGSVGDLTASRKVCVFDVPLQDALDMIRRQEKPPEHMANCLYLEWFSEANGRVVVESPDYELEISAPEWRLSAEEDAQRGHDVSAGMSAFLARLTEAIEIHRRGQKDPDKPWDEHDFERFFKECDARTTKYGELLDKYGDSDAAEAIIEKEMGWNQESEDPAGDEAFVEEMNRISEEALNEPDSRPDPAREGIDWVRVENGDLRHPLQHRCFESAMQVWQQAEERGLHQVADKDLELFFHEFRTTAVKLAGALCPIAEGRCRPDKAFTVAYLKRALGHLHQCHSALDAADSKGLLPQDMAGPARRELLEIRQSLLGLMDEFRQS